jgi:hypothetical protein
MDISITFLVKPGSIFFCGCSFGEKKKPQAAPVVGLT